MTSNLAIAAVSAVMKYVLQNPPSSDSIAAIVPDLEVSAVPPHKVDDDDPHLNIFFYRSMVNTGWAQNGLPSRNDRGERVSNPYLSLDLYYLITAHGTADYHGEILLGYAMQAFHENPVMPRQTIRDALTSASLVTTETPANVLAAFAASDLAEQFEQIRVTPHYPAWEETSNMWSNMNTGYVPTAYYKVSVVLIESKRPAKSAPPVRSYNVYALPFKQPRINDVIAIAGAGQPIFSGDDVILRGSALKGNDTRAIIGGVELSGSVLTITNDSITLPLPAGLQAGIIGAQIAHMLQIGTPPTTHQGIESNVAAFILQPRITGAAPNYDIDVLPQNASNPRRLEISLDPLVGTRQRAIVILNEINAPTTRPPNAYTFEATARDPDDPPSATLTFPIPGAADGDYLVRVRIDGAESPLDFVDPTGFVSPLVTLP